MGIVGDEAGAVWGFGFGASTETGTLTGEAGVLGGAFEEAAGVDEVEEPETFEDAAGVLPTAGTAGTC